MKSTREKIINSLSAHPDSTINDLAQAVSINGISVRHHLTNLQADGLVSAEEERHGVGRPRLVYRLTEKAMEKFPTSYLKFSNRLLDELKNTMPADKVQELMKNLGITISNGVKEDLSKLTITQQLDKIKEILVKEGFVIEWEKKNGDYFIHNISCPFFHIGTNHPEICTIDRTLISAMLGRPVKLHACVLQGKPTCSYKVELTGEVAPHA